MPLNKPELDKQLHQIQLWHNQIRGLGLMFPDVSELIKLVSDADGEVTALLAQRSTLQTETQGLRAELDAQRAKEQLEIEAALATIKSELGREIETLQHERNDLDNAVTLAKSHHEVRTATMKEERDKLAASILELSTDYAKLTTVYNEFKQKAGLV